MDAAFEKNGPGDHLIKQRIWDILWSNEIQLTVMKTKLTLTFAIIVMSASMAFACDGAKPKATKKEKATTAVEKTKSVQTGSATADKGGVLLTGSYIKQNVRRSGRFTDGVSQVIVLDRDTIERSGASDVRQLLTHQGIR